MRRVVNVVAVMAGVLLLPGVVLAQATIAGLQDLKRPDEIARKRGKSPEEVTPSGVLRAYEETQRGPQVPTEVA